LLNTTHNGGTFDGVKLAEYFYTGDGSSLPPFKNTSDMSRIIAGGDAMSQYLDGFGNLALKELTTKGTLEGLVFKDDSKRYLQDRPYIGTLENNLFSHTVLGGFSNAMAEITIVSASQISIKFTIEDHFGGSIEDASSALPGLAAFYTLQHRFSGPSKYKGFKWYFEVIRNYN
jgi:hypothetical protein